jgi:hypothetical protein
MKGYAKLTVALIVMWFIAVLSAGAQHLFTNNSNPFPVRLGLAALLPIVAFAIWFAGSQKFRGFTLSLSPSVLTLVQSWRVMGIAFVSLEAYSLLPAVFALPAGYGDMFIGATAPLVALMLANARSRNSYILWHLLGMADLVTAVTLGTTARLFSPQAASMVHMTELPLSLVPTFFVPLFFILHIISIAQARTWRTENAGISSTVHHGRNLVTPHVSA